MPFETITLAKYRKSSQAKAGRLLAIALQGLVAFYDYETGDPYIINRQDLQDLKEIYFQKSSSEYDPVRWYLENNKRRLVDIKRYAFMQKPLVDINDVLISPQSIIRAEIIFTGPPPRLNIIYRLIKKISAKKINSISDIEKALRRISLTVSQMKDFKYYLVPWLENKALLNEFNKNQVLSDQSLEECPVKELYFAESVYKAVYIDNNRRFQKHTTAVDKFIIDKFGNVNAVSVRARRRIQTFTNPQAQRFKTNKKQPHKHS